MTTPVYTISGFLGAGKTTFLNRLLSQLPQDIDAAIIVNELGEIAIDGQIIEKENYLLKEITVGCICCTLKAKLVDALIEIIDDHRPDFVLIETTGVARPKQITSEFDLKRLAEKVESTKVVSFLDASVYSKVGHKIPIINYQIEEADVVILNKVDLLDQENLAVIRDQLNAFTGGNKQVYETRFSEIDWREVFPEMKTRPEKEKETPQRKTPESISGDDPPYELVQLHEHIDSTADFATISVRADRLVPTDVIETFINTHGEKIIRAKGLLKTDRGDKLLQFSSSGLEMKDIANSVDHGQLVMIVKPEDRAEVERSLPDFFVQIH
jgi:G3E family GTPase